LITDGEQSSGVRWRFYDLPGGITAVRTGPGSAYGFEIASDQHGTNTLYLDSTAQTPTWRCSTPTATPEASPPAPEHSPAPGACSTTPSRRAPA